MLSIFSCAYWPSVYRLGKCLFRSFAHFSIGLLAFLLLSCISCLCILKMKHLSVALFDIIFSHSVLSFFFFFVFLPFLGPLSRHMEVPRLGVQSEP